MASPHRVFWLAVSVPKSFEDVETWRKEFLQQARIDDSSGFPFVTVGNKIDCDSLVPERRVDEYCEAHGPMTHIRASAKDGRNVDAIFQAIAQAIFKRSEEEDDVEFAPFLSCSYPARTHLIHFAVVVVWHDRWLEAQNHMSVDLESKPSTTPQQQEGCCSS